MRYRIDWTPAARSDLEHLSRRERIEVERGVPRHLGDQPATASHKRKPMDPNPLGVDWELRLGDIRVYYDIRESSGTVVVTRVGVKRRERVFLRGVAYNMRLH